MSLFLELLQISVGNREELSKIPAAREWADALDEAQRQAVVGVLVSGMERLPKEQLPPQVILLQWIGLCQQIEAQNTVTTKTCQELCEQFEKDGFKDCVLKGQANHRYYPKEMANRRSCGDIDIWVVPSEFKDSSSNYQVRKTLEYVDSHWTRTGLCWLHCNFNHGSEVLVEVHFHPSFFSRPKNNRRFQHFFANIEQCVERARINDAEISAMRVDRDVIYQMNHLYRHLIDEGVGLRQVIDYYYMLRYFNEHESPSIEQKLSINKTVEHLGMKRFAGALMYVLRELLGMPEEFLLCEASVMDGQFLMDEILMAGNFGHGDPRMSEISSKGYLKGRLSQAWRRFKRNMRFLSSYPGEVIWEPVVRVEHFAWKEFGLWKY